MAGEQTGWDSHSMTVAGSVLCPGEQRCCPPLKSLEEDWKHFPCGLPEVPFQCLSLQIYNKIKVVAIFTSR